MAEPESAVLPITPYPIGCLYPQVTGNFRSGQPVQRRRRLLYRADVHTTKDLRLAFSRLRGGSGSNRVVPPGT